MRCLMTEACVSIDEGYAESIHPIAQGRLLFLLMLIF